MASKVVLLCNRSSITIFSFSQQIESEETNIKLVPYLSMEIDSSSESSGESETVHETFSRIFIIYLFYESLHYTIYNLFYLFLFQVSVCIKCGNEGFEETLVYCFKCQNYALHRYFSSTHLHCMYLCECDCHNCGRTNRYC